MENGESQFGQEIWTFRVMQFVNRMKSLVTYYYIQAKQISTNKFNVEMIVAIRTSLAVFFLHRSCNYTFANSFVYFCKVKVAREGCFPLAKNMWCGSPWVRFLGTTVIFGDTSAVLGNKMAAIFIQQGHPTTVSTKIHALKTLSRLSKVIYHVSWNAL